MKNLVRNCVVASAMFVAGTVGADVIADLNPYVGAEYQQSWMRSKGFVKDFAPKSFPGATVYVGTKFNENFGLELGGSFKEKKKTTVIAPASLELKAKVNTLHADLVGFMPVAENTELFASAGVGRAKLTATRTALDVSDKETVKKWVARAGLGANYMVTDMFGVRAKLGWENTSRINRDLLKDTVTASAGAFVRF